MTTFLSTNRIVCLAGGTLAAVLTSIAFSAQITAVESQSGLVSFEAPTSMPGVEVKGKSTALSAHAYVTRDENNLVLQQIRATLPVKSLATG
jgi:hypothetical protein